MDALGWVATIWLTASAGSVALVLLDIVRGYRQHIWIMDLVWPLTTLWAGPVGLYYYVKVGRFGSEPLREQAPEKPFRQVAGVAASHCGAGCTLGDLTAEWFLFFVPLTLAGSKVFAAWTLDFMVAYLIGIVFQYFTIQPMRHLGFKQGLLRAVKADTLSITAWQVGMYGWMAIAIFAIFGHEIPKTDPVFWFMMQIAMFAGFATAFPVNWLLVKKRVKEPM